MRKVTEKAAEAMRHGYGMKSGNTTVHDNGNVMELHGNTIAIYDRVERLLTLRDCGWTSATTKERLNGLLDTFGVPKRIVQKGGEWFVVTAGNVEAPEKWDGWKVFEV